VTAPPDPSTSSAGGPGVEARRSERPSRLLAWLEHPSQDAGLHPLKESAWEFQSYAQLAERVRTGASAFLRAGVRHGDVVAIAEPECTAFVTAFFATLYAGATPMPLAPHASLDAHHAVRQAAILGSVDPAFVICSDEARTDLASACRRAGCRAALLGLGGGEPQAGEPQEPAGLALLQFTSGSTGLPRGVRITWGNLESNVATIVDWMEVDSIESASMWLPLHHDMGLIGLIAWVCGQVDTWVMRPEQFVLDPVRWLERLGTLRVPVTGAPNFAFAYIARRVAAERLRGIDLSACRSVVVGAERVLPAALAGFAELTAEHGFRPEAFSPAYGMAEATLAVTGHAVGSVASMVRIGWEDMDMGTPVKIRDRRSMTEVSRLDCSGFLVSCGRPFAGVTIGIAGDDGRALPDGSMGEITIEGPSVAAGYHTDAIGASRFEAGRIMTGDAGFVLDGELFVLGRMGDSVKLGGRHVWAESLEIQIGAALDVSPHRCLVVARPGPVSDVVAIVVEAPPEGWADRVVSLVRSEVGTSVEIVLYEAGQRTILRTTSGKPRRREMWRRLAAGDIDAEQVAGPVGRGR